MIVSTQSGFELKSVAYQQDSETYRFKYDQDTTPASMAVVGALSKVMNTDPIEVEPLYYTIDTDALDEIVRVRGTANGSAHISFSFEEYAITVSSDGVVEVAPSGHERTDDRSEDIRHK